MTLPHDVPYLLRFFRTVPPLPPLMVGTFAVLTLMASGVVVIETGRAPSAMVPILLLQLFAASSGFAAPARRGHYDLLLTRGHGRLLIALAHWVTSIAPGLASWVIVGTVELTMSDGTSQRVFASGTWAAMGLVSTLPWALTVRLPRFSAAIGWLLVAASAGTICSSSVFGEWIVNSTRIDEVAAAAWIFLLNPLEVVGRSLSGPQVMAVTPALVVAVCAMVLACRWVVDSDIPLEAAQ